MSNITIELSKEDRKVLESLTDAVSLLASVLGSMQPGQVQQTIVQEATEIEHPADTSTKHLEPQVAETNSPADENPAVEPVVEAEPVPNEPTPEVKVIPFPEFQAAVTRVVAKGTKQKAAAREIINKYGGSVSAVPEDKRAEAMAELAKI